VELVTHAEAARIKENYIALLRQLEYDRESGKVVEIDVVMQRVAERYASVRTRMLAIPTKIAPRAAVLTSPEELRALIEEAVIEALQELSLGSVGGTVSGRGRKPH
jgi:lysozyme family protein